MRLRLTNQFSAIDAAGTKYTINEFSECDDETGRPVNGVQFYFLFDRSSPVNRISENEFEIVESGERLSVTQLDDDL